MIYTDQICPCCGRPFTEDDDIVVCPDCGTPHHRACYESLGTCANSDRHASGFQWENPSEETGRDAAASERSETAVCPKCGNPDCRYNTFCGNCGHFIAEPLIEAEEGSAALPESFDGIPAERLRAFIKRNAEFYLYHFDAMDRKHRNFELNAVGFLFPTFYYFYRKMTRQAVLSLAVMTVLCLPSYICSILVQSGIHVGAFSTVSAVLLLLSVGYRIYTALFSIGHYRKYCADHLSSADSENTSGKSGGTSILSVVILIAALSVLALVINLII